MTTPNPKIVELSKDQLEALLHRAEAALREDDYERIKALAEAYTYLTELVEAKGTTIERLRKLLFGSPTEKTRDVVPPTEEDGSVEVEPTPKRKGHGRNGADAYRGAEKIEVPHESLRTGDACPDCTKGKVYEMARPGGLIRITGQAPVQAKVYELQRLRCHLCGKVFTAPAPKGVGPAKYDATSASMIALLKYGSGFPFNRLQGLQGSLGIPLSASTQWGMALPFVSIEVRSIRASRRMGVLWNQGREQARADCVSSRMMVWPVARTSPVGRCDAETM